MPRSRTPSLDYIIVLLVFGVEGGREWRVRLGLDDLAHSPAIRIRAKKSLSFFLFLCSTAWLAVGGFGVRSGMEMMSARACVYTGLYFWNLDFGEGRLGWLVWFSFNGSYILGYGNE